MPEPLRPIAKGRGSSIQPLGRFTRLAVEDDFEQVEGHEEFHQRLRGAATEYYVDDSKTVVTENDSPDVGFRYSLNPYRGCSHGCSYCYARPTHEYFELSAGLDFETKIFVKERAPELFREWLSRASWKPEPIMFSGVTDCYQPAERHFKLTRRCLEVALETRQPVCIVSKNALVTRDLDLLAEMAKRKLVSVAISITTLDQSLVRVMEPRTSSPEARLRTLTELSQAGVPTRVMIAPVVPGLTDSEMPAILKAAGAAGADSAAYILLRLPRSVREVFLDFLTRCLPQQKQRVESRIRSTRGGDLYDTRWGKRMRGTGELAEQIRRTFEVFSRRYGLDRKSEPLDTTQFRRPLPASGQQRLFAE
jgi:DNA repair photolyase